MRALTRLAEIGAERHCAGCAHYLGESCRHPDAKDNWGTLSGMRRYLPDDVPVWPRKHPTDGCGWWRQAPGATEAPA